MRFLLALLLPLSLSAQTDTLSKPSEENMSVIDSNRINTNSNHENLAMTTPFKLTPKQFIVPGILIGYGVLATETKI